MDNINNNKYMHSQDSKEAQKRHAYARPYHLLTFSHHLVVLLLCSRP